MSFYLNHPFEDVEVDFKDMVIRIYDGFTESRPISYTIKLRYCNNVWLVSEGILTEETTLKGLFNTYYDAVSQQINEQYQIYLSTCGVDCNCDSWELCHLGHSKYCPHIINKNLKRYCEHQTIKAYNYSYSAKIKF